MRNTLIVGLLAALVPACLLLWFAGNSEVPSGLQLSGVTRRSIPVIYDYDLHERPRPLTEEQLEKLLLQVESRNLDARDIWYIRVHDNWLVGWWDVFASKYTAIVYFKPYYATPRSRRGRYIRLIQGYDINWKELREKYPEWDKGVEERELKEYWQVSLASEPFGSELTVPKQQLWPFDVSGEFANQDIVAIVDRARTYFKELSDREDFVRPGYPSEPILWIEHWEGKIELYTGVLPTPLSGRGQFIECKKEEGRFVISGAGLWES